MGAEPPRSETIDLSVTALGGRGDGVARLPTGEVVFVPDVAPGDVVRAVVRGKRRGVKRAEVRALLHAGPHRTAPRCPVAGPCGGCAWQHVSLEGQRQEKARNVAQAIGREAKAIGEVPAWGWRRRLRAHLRRGPEGLAIGFMGAGSGQLVATTACPVLEPPLEALLARVCTWADGWLARGELLAHLGAEGIVAQVQGVGSGGALPRLATEGPDIAAQLGVVGLSLSVDGVEGRWGAETVTLAETADTHPVSVDAGGFSQASAAANGAIRAAVAEALSRCGPLDGALELYAGSGNLTGLLLEHAPRVRTLEWDAAAVARARERFGGRAQVSQGDAARVAHRPEGREVWLLDPGRPGAADACRRIATLGPAHVVYVSCAPHTLRRDLGLLAGYSVVDAWWIDTFPHTPHAEVVVLLERG